MNPMDVKAAWVLLFATHLHKIVPTIRGATAARIGEETYPSAGDLSPAEAAEMFVNESLPGKLREEH